MKKAPKMIRLQEKLDNRALRLSLNKGKYIRIGRLIKLKSQESRFYKDFMCGIQGIITLQRRRGDSMR